MLTSQGGFAGTVAITATLIDTATQAAIPKVTLALQASADLAADGTAMVPITITIPSDTSGTAISGNLKIDLTSSVAPEVVNSAVNIDHIFTVDYVNGNGATQANHSMAV